MFDYYASKEEDDGEDFDCLVQMMIVDEKDYCFNPKYRKANKYFEISLPSSILLVIIFIDLDDYDDKPQELAFEIEDIIKAQQYLLASLIH